MLQASQLIEFLTNLIGGPTFRGQGEITVHIRPALHKLGFEFFDRSRDLLINLAAHTGSTQEEGVTEETSGDVDIADAAEQAVAAERVEGLARVPEKEENEYDIADSINVKEKGGGQPAIIGFAFMGSG
jgi:hypothetical protein